MDCASSAPAAVGPLGATFCYPGKARRPGVSQDRTQHLHPVVRPQRVIQPGAATEAGKPQGLGLDGLNKVARLIAPRACSALAGLIDRKSVV